jgi:hypothetical protein
LFKIYVFRFFININKLFILGEADAGGVLYDPRGNWELNYYWNIGITSNNKVESYTVYQGVQLAKQNQIIELNSVGDSKNTIRYFVLISSPKDTGLKNLFERIRKSFLGIKVHFYHIY